MEARILKEKGDRDVASIKELNLNNCKSNNVTGLSEDWKSLESLKLSNVGLTSLKGFPRLPSLKKLELSGNNICEGLDALACLPKLEELNLSGNKLKDLEVLEPLSLASNLKMLSLKGCDVCKIEKYRQKVFEAVPSLLHVDGLNKNKTQENGVENGQGDEEVEDESPSENEESFDEEEDEEDDDEDDDENEGDIPLEALYGKINDEVDDDDDFEVVEDEEDEDIDEEDEDEPSINTSQDHSEETEEVRGTKRKHEDN